MTMELPHTHTLDLQFMGMSGRIASYLIPHARGATLIESGPGSTLAALQTGLAAHGLSAADVTDVFLTHIHLDHAGAAGWLARQGARIHVHEVGAPHMLDPEKLLASAKRIYGDSMDMLWGEFLPVPTERLSVLHDGDTMEVGGLQLRALSTPGHAEHHLVYLCEDICFSGDIGGVRLPGFRHVRLPMPPPEFHLEKWRESLERLQQERIAYIAPTHFGIFDDAARHLTAIAKALDEVETWMMEVMPTNSTGDALEERFTRQERTQAQADGLDDGAINAYELVNPAWMSARGIQRYWQKYRG